MSGKPKDFIAGADIAMLGECKTPEDFSKITGPVHELFNQMSRYVQLAAPFGAADPANIPHGSGNPPFAHPA